MQLILCKYFLNLKLLVHCCLGTKTNQEKRLLGNALNQETPPYLRRFSKLAITYCIKFLEL